MSIQHQRAVELCDELRLSGVAAQYTALAQQAAAKQSSFADFVEDLLSAERESRRSIGPSSAFYWRDAEPRTIFADRS
jgi:hypothetical protein